MAGYAPAAQRRLTALCPILEMGAMHRLEKTITIRAPVERVFAYLDDPTNHPKIWPSLTQVLNVRQLRKGGNRCRFVYKMAGTNVEGISQDIEHVLNKRIVTKNTGGVESKITWGFQPVPGGTRVTLRTEYSVPVALLENLSEGFVVRMNEHEAEILLENLKTETETHSST